MLHSSLIQNQIKRDLITQAKLSKSPAGLGVVGTFMYLKIHHNILTPILPILGVYNLYIAELALPLDERYIHNVLHTPDGAILILTFQPFLASLVHEALSFQVDTTFKRVHGELNEWEIVIFYPGTNRRKVSIS